MTTVVLVTETRKTKKRPDSCCRSRAFLVVLSRTMDGKIPLDRQGQRMIPFAHGMARRTRSRNAERGMNADPGHVLSRE